jgi:hypothetical protein
MLCKQHAHMHGDRHPRTNMSRQTRVNHACNRLCNTPAATPTQMGATHTSNRAFAGAHAHTAHAGCTCIRCTRVPMYAGNTSTCSYRQARAYANTLSTPAQARTAQAHKYASNSFVCTARAHACQEKMHAQTLGAHRRLHKVKHELCIHNGHTNPHSCTTLPTNPPISPPTHNVHVQPCTRMPTHTTPREARQAAARTPTHMLQQANMNVCTFMHLSYYRVHAATHTHAYTSHKHTQLPYTLLTSDINTRNSNSIPPRSHAHLASLSGSASPHRTTTAAAAAAAVAASAATPLAAAAAAHL